MFGIISFSNFRLVYTRNDSNTKKDESENDRVSGTIEVNTSSIKQIDNIFPCVCTVIDDR